MTGVVEVVVVAGVVEAEVEVVVVTGAAEV